MKTIGLIGGMSWESSLEYYRIINEQVKARLGGFHSAKSIMYSVDFDEVEKLLRQERWDEATLLMVDAVRRLESGGADFVVICTNTVHKIADNVQAAIKIPLLHIVDVTAEKIKTKGLKKVGLLGTKFTMEHDFYKGRLVNMHGLDVIVPDADSRQLVHNIIFGELCLGEIRQESKYLFTRIINQLIDDGAQGIILGCTEIPLLIHQEDVKALLFDTTAIHAEAAVDMALKQ